MAYAQNHCPDGHEYTPENTKRRKDGSRYCGICNRDNARKGMRARRARDTTALDLKREFKAAAAKTTKRPQLISEYEAATGAPIGETRGLPPSVNLGACYTCKTEWIGENVQFERSGYAWCVHCSLGGNWRIYTKWQWGKRLDSSALVEAEVNTYLKARPKRLATTSPSSFDAELGNTAEPRRVHRPVEAQTWRDISGGAW